MAFKGEWKPFPKQEFFLSLPLTWKEAGYGGGAGSAKTDTLIMYPIVHKWHEHPAFKQLFQRRTFPELRNEVMPRTRQIYPKFGATFNKSDMIWTFPAPDQFGGRGLANYGASIYLGHCEDEEDVYKYDSMEINLYTPDELTSFTRWIYMYIGFTRVRTSYPELPAIIRAGFMPGGIGHTWVRQRFVDVAPPGQPVRGKGDNVRIYIHATQADNPYIDPNYKKSLEALPEAEKRAKLYGDWNAFSGQVFDEFRDRKFDDEPENALHVIKPFEIPEWWPKFIVGDWGFAAMAWVGFAAVSPDKRLYIYRELSWKKVKIEMWAPYVREYIERENPRFVEFCQSAGQDRGQDKTIQEQLSDALGVTIELSGNKAGSRVAGKQLIHEYLRWTPKPVLKARSEEVYSEERAAWIYRNRSIFEYRAYVDSFYPPEPELLPKLQIFDTCPVLIEAIKACSYDKKKVEDIAEFDGDDPIDALRYIVDAAERFFEEAVEEFAKVQKREEILKTVQQNQDFTAFYRNMRALEASDKVKVVSRYHHKRQHV